MLLTIVIFSLTAKSQIDKHFWMIGGSASFRSSKYDNIGGLSSKQTIVDLTGDVGYFIIDKLVVGLKPGFSRTETNNPHNVALEFTLGYSSFSYNTSGTVKSLISGIGFHFHLEKEK